MATSIWFTTLAIDGNVVPVLNSAPIPNPDFTTVWDTRIAGASAAGAILLPIVDNATDFNLDIFVDGVFLRKIVNTAGKTITAAELGAAGLKTITLVGEMNSWSFSFAGDINKIVDITQWGQFDSGTGSNFQGCANLNITATDTPLVLLTRSLTQPSLQAMFFGCTILNSANLLLWNFNGVKLIGGGFFAVSGFNQPIGTSWDVSTVTSLAQLFDTSLAFNQPLGDFDVQTRPGRTTLTMNRMLFSGPMNSTNYNATLIGWAAQTSIGSGIVQNVGATGFNGRQYTSAASAARATLVSGNGWTISGDTLI
jgi:hypothetical protein